jgi:hypothetical protein
LTSGGPGMQTTFRCVSMTASETCQTFGYY